MQHFALSSIVSAEWDVGPCRPPADVISTFRGRLQINTHTRPTVSLMTVNLNGSMINENCSCKQQQFSHQDADNNSASRQQTDGFVLSVSVGQ